MARGRKVTYHIDVDETGAVIGAQKVEQSLDDVDQKAGRLGKTTGNLKSRLSSVGAVAAGAAAAGLGLALSSAMSRSISKGREFESQLAELEAITGITGNRLQRLGDRSLELSKKYGTAASDIIEANKLVASQLAEKIDFNTEEGFQQLQEISEQAIVLQKAAGTDLATAVETTTGIINQFNLEASESGRVINNLAAGAKFGAAEIPDIARAMVNAGSAASSANVSLAETNAAIQVLAANGQVGERAGTALRAIFTRLRTESEALAEAGIKNVNIESQGLNATLQKLKPLLDDTAAAKKIFGEEALNQIQILIREAEAHGSLAEKVQDTQTAHEQAAVNMNTFDGAAARLSETFNSELIKAFQESDGVLVDLMNSTATLIEHFAGGIRIINDWVDVHSELRDELNLQEGATDSNIRSMQNLRKELAAAARDGELSADQQAELREAYQATNEQLRNQASELFDSTHALKQRRDEVKSNIKEIQDQLSNAGPGQGSVFLQAKLETLKQELEGLNIEISSNEQQLKQYRKALQEGSLSFDEYVQKVREAVKAEQERNESGEETEEKQTTLTDQLKEKKKQLDQLIASEDDLTGETWEQAKALAEDIANTEELIEKRKELLKLAVEGAPEAPTIDPQMPQDQVISADIDTTMPEQDFGGPLGSLAAAQERFNSLKEEFSMASSEEERKKLLDDLKTAKNRVDELSSGLGGLGSSGNENMQAVLKVTNMVGDALLRAALRGGDLSKVLADIALQLASKALINGLGMLLTGGAFSFAGLFGFGGGGIVPQAQRGMVARGPSHAQGGMMGMVGGKPMVEFEGGEAIINKKATEMFLPELSAINQAGGGVPLAAEGALTLNSVPRDSRPIPSAGGSGIDTGAIAAAVREGIEGMNLIADIKDISAADSELQNKNKRIAQG